MVPWSSTSRRVRATCLPRGMMDTFCTFWCLMFSSVVITARPDSRYARRSTTALSSILGISKPDCTLSMAACHHEDALGVSSASLSTSASSTCAPSPRQCTS
eukprot:scaffold1749_cov289-Prasinococcus_capsulatus_cf.AAC.3